MKHLFFIFCLVFSIFVCGCNSVPQQSNTVIKPEVILPPLEEQPTEDETKKKAYAVSTVNGLRVRNAPNNTGTVIGTLDKGDAIAFLQQDGNYVKTLFKEQTAYVHISYCDVMQVDVGEQAVEKTIDFASGLLGYPYVWGSQRYHWGNGKLNANFVNGQFDCSALVQYAYFITNGVILDLTSRTQSLNGYHVDKSDLQRGDLMFFTNASRKDKVGIEKIGHVGIYFGNNYILHTASDHAVIEPISSIRWGYYITARRVV